MTENDKYILINGCKHLAYTPEAEYDENTTLKKSEEFLENIDKRKSIRTFSSKPVSKIVIENIIRSASTAPSGAHKQPWVFCAISNAEIKKKIRIAADTHAESNEFSGENP